MSRAPKSIARSVAASRAWRQENTAASRNMRGVQRVVSAKVRGVRQGAWRPERGVRQSAWRPARCLPGRHGVLRMPCPDATLFSRAPRTLAHSTPAHHAVFRKARCNGRVASVGTRDRGSHGGLGVSFRRGAVGPRNPRIGAGRTRKCVCAVSFFYQVTARCALAYALAY